MDLPLAIGSRVGGVALLSEIPRLSWESMGPLDGNGGGIQLEILSQSWAVAMLPLSLLSRWFWAVMELPWAAGLSWTVAGLLRVGLPL